MAMIGVLLRYIARLLFAVDGSNFCWEDFTEFTPKEFYFGLTAELRATLDALLLDFGG